MFDLCNVELQPNGLWKDLTVKNVLNMRNDKKIIFITQAKRKIQLIIPYMYFSSQQIKVGEVYNLIRCPDFMDIDDVRIENYQLISTDYVKNFNLYY